MINVWKSDLLWIRFKWIAIFKKVCFGKNGSKFFTGCKSNGEIKPLCIMVPKVSGYVNILMNLNTYLNKILDKNSNINKKT